MLRSGKRLPSRRAQIVVTFKCPPVALFEGTEPCTANQIVITIQPDEAFDLRFNMKKPGAGLTAEAQSLIYRYEDAGWRLPEAYETLLEDVMRGDSTLFVRADEVKAAWGLYTPILKAKPVPFPYPAGTWGPPEADRLLEGDAAWTTC